MLIGAMVLCSLVLLVLVADRAGSWVSGYESEQAFYRCDSCDLRYQRREVGSASPLLCPAGHLLINPLRRRTSAGTVAICACLGFLTLSALLIISGIVPLA